MNKGGGRAGGRGASRFHAFIVKLLRVKRFSSIAGTNPVLEAPQVPQSRKPCGDRKSTVTVNHIGKDVEKSNPRLSTFIRNVSATDSAGAMKLGGSTNTGQIFGIVRQVDGVIR